MRSQSFIINSALIPPPRPRPLFLCIGGIFFLVLLLAGHTAAQKLAVLTPERSAQNEQFVLALRDGLSGKFLVLDDGLSESAFRSVNPETPFNMTIETAKNVGAVIGCEYYVMIRSGTQRRASLEKTAYYEAFAAIFAVSSRTGRLVFWRLQSREASDPKEADRLLEASAKDLAAVISDRLKTVSAEELSEKPSGAIEEMPAPESPDAKIFRSPMPYKRIKPEYTNTAYLYNIAATVDVNLDVDEKGNILRLETVRWAGYGLDESVADAVRKMNWRAGERNGRSLSVRVLLRYNFKKIDKEE